MISTPDRHKRANEVGGGHTNGEFKTNTHTQADRHKRNQDNAGAEGGTQKKWGAPFWHTLGVGYTPPVYSRLHPSLVGTQRRQGPRRSRLRRCLSRRCLSRCLRPSRIVPPMTKQQQCVWQFPICPWQSLLDNATRVKRREQRPGRATLGTPCSSETARLNKARDHKQCARARAELAAFVNVIFVQV